MNKEQEKRITSLIENGILKKMYIDRDFESVESVIPRFSFSYSESTYLSEGYQVDHPLYEIPLTLHGDYLGTTVEKSNYQALSEKYPTIITRVFLDFSSSVVCLNPGRLFTKEHSLELDCLLSDLEDLLNYPLLDEDSLSKMEFDLETEYIQEEILPELYLYIEDNYSIPETIISELFLINLVRETMQEENEYPIFETGTSCFIKTDSLFPILYAKIDKTLTSDTSKHEELVYSILYGIKASETTFINKLSSDEQRELFFSILKNLSETDQTFKTFEPLSDYFLHK